MRRRHAAGPGGPGSAFAGGDVAAVADAEHGEEQDEEGDAQEQMQQHRWPSRPPSPRARLRSAAVSLLQNRAHVVFDPALAKIWSTSSGRPRLRMCASAVPISKQDRPRYTGELRLLDGQSDLSSYRGRLLGRPRGDPEEGSRARTVPALEVKQMKTNCCKLEKSRITARCLAVGDAQVLGQRSWRGAVEVLGRRRSRRGAGKVLGRRRSWQGAWSEEITARCRLGAWPEEIMAKCLAGGDKGEMLARGGGAARGGRRRSWGGGGAGAERDRRRR